MSIQLISFASGSLFCLLSAVFVCISANRSRLKLIDPTTAMYASVLASCAAYAYWAWNNTDFIMSISPLKYLFPLMAALPLLALTHFHTSAWLRFLIIIISAGACLTGLTYGSDIFLTPNFFIAAATWVFCSISMRPDNSSDGVVPTHLLSGCIGIFILSLIGAAPLALGFGGICLAAAVIGFLIFNWPPAILKLSDSKADFWGFTIGGLFAIACLEGAASSVIIFAMMPFCETIFACLQKLTFLPRFANIQNNTFCAKATASGLNPQILAAHAARINVLMVLFGCFQVYAPNQTSIPFICMVIVIWQMYRLVNWNSLSSGVLETNRNVVSELKKNFSDVQKQLKQINSKKRKKSKTGKTK